MRPPAALRPLPSLLLFVLPLCLRPALAPPHCLLVAPCSALLCSYTPAFSSPHSSPLCNTSNRHAMVESASVALLRRVQQLSAGQLNTGQLSAGRPHS